MTNLSIVLSTARVNYGQTILELLIHFAFLESNKRLLAITQKILLRHTQLWPPNYGHKKYYFVIPNYDHSPIPKYASKYSMRNHSKQI